MKVNPVHSVHEDIYHNNNKCNDRNKIAPENIRPGTGGKKICIVCESLNKVEKKPMFSFLKDLFTKKD